MSFTNFLLGANLGASIAGHTATNRNLANVHAAIHAQSQQLAYAEHERQWADQITVWSRELEARGWTPLQANEEARRERARSEAYAELANASARYDQLTAAHTPGAYLVKSRSTRIRNAFLSGMAAVVLFVGILIGAQAGEAVTTGLFIILTAGCAAWSFRAALAAVRLTNAIAAVVAGRQPKPSRWVTRALDQQATTQAQLDADLAASINHCQQTLRYWRESPLHDSHTTDRVLSERLRELNRTVIDLTERTPR